MCEDVESKYRCPGCGLQTCRYFLIQFKFEKFSAKKYENWGKVSHEPRVLTNKLITRRNIDQQSLV